MGAGSITYFVNGFYYCIESCIIPKSIGSTIYIIVYSTWDTHYRESKFLVEKQSTCERTVSSDNYQCICFGSYKVIIGFLASFRRTKFLRTSRLEEGASTIDKVTDTTGIQRGKVIFYHALVASVYT